MSSNRSEGSIGLPSISVVIIDSRSEQHPAWVDRCLQSVTNQFHKPIEVIVVKNTDKSKSIGECWNKAIPQAKGKWVLFVGDDDYISEDYLQALGVYIRKFERNGMRIDAISTYMTVFDEDMEGMGLLSRPPMGCYRTDYIKQFRFNESLKRGVDRQFLEERKKEGIVYVIIPHHHGYYYRQHSESTCARVGIVQEAKPIYMLATWPHFLRPIADRLGDDVYFSNHAYEEQFGNEAEVIWCDWANENAILVSQHRTKARKILRVHAYEVYREWVHHIDYDAFDHVIFVADHIRNHLEKRIGKRLKNGIVIPNGIDLKRFELSNHYRNDDIAWVGNLDNKKGAQMLLLLAQQTQDYNFHVIGNVVQDDIKQLFNYRDLNNIIFHPYTDHIEEFYHGKSYILNTSPREGCPVSVLEAMACGLKPVIYNWEGSKQFLSPRFVFDTPYEFHKILEDTWTPFEYRAFVEERHDFEEMYKKFKQLMGI